MRALLPYLDDYWRAHIQLRGLERDNYAASAFPANAPINARPDWKPAAGAHGTDVDALRAHVLDAFQSRYAICNVLHGSPAIFSEDLSAALCRAINDWMAHEWLAKDDRLRASIVVPMHSPDLAAREIERCAADKRFVQVLVWEMAEIPIGRRINWPILRACEAYDLPLGVHAGSSYRHPPTNLGWPSYYLEDYVSWSTGFAGVLNSLISEGAFVEFPRLKVVLMESGVTWLPGWMWRLNKTWRGIRAEVPWLDKSPAEYAREHVRLTIQPFDAPPKAEQLLRIVDQIDCEDMLLFSTDYPHWHFDGTDALPDGLPERLLRKILVDNPLKTYTRLTA
jgi:predicted TIM-barrel fold metal-dependent hydrolase